MTITYTSSRGDIVFAYFRTWRQSTRMKIIQIAMVALVYLVNQVGGGSVLKGILLAVAVLAFSFLFPQLMFKSGVRSLTISAAGISTTIGSHSGEVPWTSIHKIEDIADRIVVMGNN